VVVHGELGGQKNFAFKPPLVMVAIMQLHRVMALGQIEEGEGEHELSPKPWRSKCVEAISRDKLHPYGIGTWPSLRIKSRSIFE
jgi:hypothetical protein